ncbi:unnamed protein product, partial [Nippostrongylus brasiliensis]|uniref:Calpain_III domain-containing protein n=1 Tax=Nippostrongylus brasiliensis TaxID=27835 RepID=A0A0N4YWI7_NIPBR
GVSCSHSVTLLREVVSAINNIFRVNIKEILYDTPDYDNFLQALYEQAAFELHSKHRWVEMVQFTTMLRNLDVTPGRGNVLPYLYGYIGATDWENSPHFPYRVHFSKSKDPWPSETSVSAWVSPYDVLPTSYDLMVTSEEGEFTKHCYVYFV